MNLAIILAVSNYQTTTCLPGCVLDAQLMKALLETTEKYNELLLIEQDTDSLKVKQKISNFISSNRDKIFDEAFFYYTGHGDFRDNEFYYILSDFDRERYRQTTLANSELDNWLRQLSSGLTVKIIDACHSGVTYIKDNDIFDKHLNESKNNFKHCYFMFSSMSNQSSYQSNTISHFTKSFIESVLNYASTEIRYKHIIDYISDEFEKNSLQQPFFITQAGFTEVFCSVNQKLKRLVSEHLNVSLESKTEAGEGEVKVLSLVNSVRKDAERYCSEKEVIENLDIAKHFIKNYSYSQDLMELYKITADFENEYTSILNEFSSIGKWLEDNKNNYFAKVSYKRELINTDKNLSALSNLNRSFLNIYGDPSDNYKTVVSGFELTTESPYKLIKINATPNYPNIDACDCKITFVFSQVSIRLFYFCSNLKLATWNDYTYNFSSNWQTVEVEMKNIDKLKETVFNILTEFDSFVLEPLKAKYILSVEGRLDRED